MARTVIEQGRNLRLLAFNLVDSHLHSEVAESHRVALEFARRVEITVNRRLRLDVRFTAVRAKPIRDQAHLINLFDYIFRQQSRHGLECDPYSNSSNLPDLLGLRVLGTYMVQHVRQFLPRVTRAQLLTYLAVENLDPVDGLPTNERDHRLAEAAAAAIGRTKLIGYSAEVCAARIAAARIANQKWTTDRIAKVLGVHRRTIERFSDRPIDPCLIQAVRLQLALRHDRSGSSSSQVPLKTHTGGSGNSGELDQALFRS